MRRTARGFLLLAVLAIVEVPGSPALGQEQGAKVETSLVAEVLIEPSTASGRPARFAPARVLKEGQQLFYTLRIRNPSTEFARSVVVMQDIPKNTTYVPASAAGPGAIITFSTDGGQTYAAEDKLRVTDAAGASRPALPQEYTNIRWQLRNALAPGAIALARFRAVFR
jgi:uncharacterized repeat protein (TIGR01451 family)